VAEAGAVWQQPGGSSQVQVAHPGGSSWGEAGSGWQQLAAGAGQGGSSKQLVQGRVAAAGWQKLGQCGISQVAAARWQQPGGSSQVQVAHPGGSSWGEAGSGWQQLAVGRPGQQTASVFGSYHQDPLAAQGKSRGSACT
jgi:hypothetical protein